jgi:hypothetical protein
MPFVVPSKKIAMPSLSPAMAPTRARSGCTAVSDWVGADLATTGGGRRVGAKIGRSLVAVNEAREIAHKGLPLPIEFCVPPAKHLEGDIASTVLLDNIGQHKQRRQATNDDEHDIDQPREGWARQITVDRWKGDHEDGPRGLITASMWKRSPASADDRVVGAKKVARVKRPSQRCLVKYEIQI